LNLRNKSFPVIAEVLDFLQQNTNSLTTFHNWLFYNFQQKPEKSIENKAILAEILLIISEIMDENVELDFDENDVFFRYKNNEQLVPFNILSDGEKNIIGWVGHLMKRLWEVWDEWYSYRNIPIRTTKFTEHPAIVLIDEIDTYLHISVQQKILAVLVEKFPNIQFIVTTHSPYTIGSIPNDKIKIYVCKKEGDSVEVEEFDRFNAFGADIEQLTQLLYDVPTRAGSVTIENEIIPIATAFAEMRNAIQRNDLDFAERYGTAIESSGIATDDGELMSLQALLRTKKRMTLKL
jgi:hypothetical protein